MHILTAGQDFDIPIETFRVSVTNTARRHGKHVVTTRNGTDVLAVQAFDTPEAAEAARRGEYDDGYGDLGPEDL
jgi:hypothetical protein